MIIATTMPAVILIKMPALLINHHYILPYKNFIKMKSQY